VLVLVLDGFGRGYVLIARAGIVRSSSGRDRDRTWADIIHANLIGC
jgi:hypothetical protein